VGRFAAGVAELARPPVAGQACSVVRLNGGTGVNSIPSVAWAEVDVRGEQSGSIDALEAALRELAGEALQAENQRRARGTVPLQLAVEITGNRPTGTTPPADPLVRAAVDATRAVGREPELAIASTDANVPISLGIPAVALGAGGAAGHTHLETEWYDDGGGTDGLFRALLVLAAAAGLEDGEAP
jgi:acetylornithine deacetylase/succinyl-diaminopimelate desuccinylase-like protein